MIRRDKRKQIRDERRKINSLHWNGKLRLFYLDRVISYMRASEWSDRLSFSSPSDADAARLALAKNFVFTSRRSATRPIREANYASRSADCAGYLSPRLAISRRAHANIIKADYEFKPPMSDGTFKRPSSTVDTLDSISWSELSDNNVHNPSTSCLQSCVHTKDSFYDHRQSHFFFRLTVWKGSRSKKKPDELMADERKGNRNRNCA